jgi:predicted enzyme related to lactoylglutathione lyase
VTRFVINVDVPDVDAAARFYCAAFGLEPGRRFGSDFRELVGGPTELYLLAKAAGTDATLVDGAGKRDYARHWTPTHLDFVVDDIDAAKARVLEAGATLEEDVRIRAWGKLAMFADPWGHGFCLIEFVGRGYDEITG